MADPDSSPRPHTADAVTGLGFVAITIGIIVSLPLLTASDVDGDTVVLSRPGSVAWTWLLTCVLVQGVVIVWARHLPRHALVVAAGVAFAVSWAFPGSLYGITGAAILLLVFLAVVREPLMRLRLPLLGVGILVTAGEVVNGIGGEHHALADSVTSGVVQSVGLIALPLLLGLVVRSRRDVQDARRNEQKARTGQRAAEVRAAVSSERTAMARELHDIAAHHLSGIALMAAVIDRQIDTNPKEAHRGAQQVRAQSTAVLDDLRRLVGLLRDDNGEDRAVETLASIPTLIARAEQHGPIDSRVLTGESRPLGTGMGPLTQLAAYRTVQEALTNAANHAPGAHRTVEIDDRDASVTVVTVTNLRSSAHARSRPTTEPSPSSGGFGLVGMRERAELVGATIHYGAVNGAGWEVRAKFPKEQSPTVPTKGNPNAAETT